MKIILEEKDNLDYFKNNDDDSYVIVLGPIRVHVSAEKFENIRSKIIEKYKYDSGSKRFHKFSKVPESFMEEVSVPISQIVELAEKYELDSKMEEVLACCDHISQRKTRDVILEAMKRNIPKKDRNEI